MRFKHFTDIQKKIPKPKQPSSAQINRIMDLITPDPIGKLIQFLCFSGSTLLMPSDVYLLQHLYFTLRNIFLTPHYLRLFEWLFSYFYIKLLHKYQLSKQCTTQNCFFKFHLGKENTTCFKVAELFFFYLN